MRLLIGSFIDGTTQSLVKDNVLLTMSDRIDNAISQDNFGYIVIKFAS